MSGEQFHCVFHFDDTSPVKWQSRWRQPLVWRSVGLTRRRFAPHHRLIFGLTSKTIKICGWPTWLLPWHSFMPAKAVHCLGAYEDQELPRVQLQWDTTDSMKGSNGPCTNPPRFWMLRPRYDASCVWQLGLRLGWPPHRGPRSSMCMSTRHIHAAHTFQEKVRLLGLAFCLG